MVLTGTDAQIVRPYNRYTLKSLHVSLFDNGRTICASLQSLHVPL